MSLKRAKSINGFQSGQNISFVACYSPFAPKQKQLVFEQKDLSKLIYDPKKSFFLKL